MKQMKSASTVLGCYLILTAATASAEDLDVVANINSVTVFMAGAEVTRTATVSIPAGQHRLIFSDLPPHIDPARLQLSLSNSDVLLGNLRLEEIHQGDLISLDEQRLQGELNDLWFSRQAIVDEVESANTQLTLLDSLASGAVGGQQVSLQSGDLTGLLSTLATSSRQARQVIREENQRLQQIDKEIEQKRFEISQVATQQQSQQLLTVSVDSANSAETEVSFSYPVAQAGWSWLYEARLDTEIRQLELYRRVSVVQTSGENWDNVELNITTSKPNENTQTPVLNSLLVDIYQPQPFQQERRRLLESAAGFALDDVIEEMASTGSANQNYAPAMKQFANVNASQYLVDFHLPGRVDIAADSQPQILPIDQRRLAVDLITRAIPELDQAAYLEARFTLEQEMPIQGGIMQLYRDGAFIGKRVVADFLPQEEISLPFGKDDRVRIETRAEAEESRHGGTFRRSASQDHRVRYELTSFHPQPIDIEVLARIPVSQNDAINVDISADATGFDEENVDGSTGVIMWRQQAEPTQTIEIKHFYTVKYPQDDRLSFQEF